MSREQLEKHQVWLYLLAVVAGVVVGVRLRPEIADAAIYLPLAILLYATFAQVPVTHLPEAVRDRRYLSTALLANFVLVPAVVWLLSWLVPPEPATLLGFYMVLLLPCTDWFIVFSHLGRGDAKRAIASTPVMLLAQFLMLPLYLWLFMGETFAEVIRAGPFAQVFLLLIALPLLAAALTQVWADRTVAGQRAIATMAWLPVPCLAVVLLLVAMSQAGQVIDELNGMERVALAFGLYLVAAAGIGILTARWFALPAAAGRTLIFSIGTRNSFVVLPFVLALPAGWEMAVTVVVLQPLVELLGVLVYLRLVPRWGNC
ncbi:MAG: arsenic resistance protein [Phycisphaerae bacterium]